MKNFKRAFKRAIILAVMVAAITGMSYAALTGPTGGSGLVTPATLCQVDTGVWQFCNTGDVLGDSSNKNADGYFIALTVDTMTVATSFILSGTVSGSLIVDTGDLSLTDGRLIVATEGTQTCVDASPDTIALDLAASAKGRIVLDQRTEAGGDENCVITLSNGVAGEMVILELTFSGDNAWTFASGGIYLGDTFAAADSCQDNIATPADGDALLVMGIMIDGDTMALLSCQYTDQ